MTGAERPERALAAVYDAGADAYQRYWAPVLRPHTRALLAALPALPPGRARTILDIGAGAGTVAGGLRAVAGAGGRIMLIDRSRGMLARAPADLARVHADAARLPVADTTADVIVFGFVLFQLPDAPGGIREAARVLRPGGWLLAATWAAQHPTGADELVRRELDRAGATASSTSRVASR